MSQGTQQVHGGIGIDRDYPLFRYALFAKSIELAAGGANRCSRNLRVLAHG